MADMIPLSVPPKHDVQTDRRDRLLIFGVAVSVLALTYLFAGLHERFAIIAHPIGASQSARLPLKLFVIAVSPALTGFAFLWSEHHLRSKAKRLLLRNLGIFGFGLILAAWVALTVK